MIRKPLIGAIGVVAALGAGGAAWASAATTSAAAGASAATADPAQAVVAVTGGGPGHGHGHRSLASRADHATFEVKVKGTWVTYTVDRGKVGAVSATSITINRPDGQSVTETINGSTKYRGVSGETAIQTGRAAIVVSVNGAATRISQSSGPKPATPGTGSPSTSGTAAGVAA
ncbi:MAG: hypothetical protein KGQ66_03515 [Acidobacteriota bacterium]|nr:hypothetical protein [Acidobacteriota bacterium]